MLNISQLIAAVEQTGYVIAITSDGSPTLVRSRTDATISRVLVDGLKRNREAIVAYLRECTQCGRDCTSPEDRDRLRQVNPYCTQTPCPFRTTTSPSGG